MANMSYCRFENTLPDLQDCYNALDDDPALLSFEERRARRNLLKLCQTIATEMEDGSFEDDSEWDGKRETSIGVDHS